MSQPDAGRHRGGSQVFHPTEMIVYTLLPLALTGYCLAFASYFQHWNVRRAAASRGTDGTTLRAS